MVKNISLAKYIDHTLLKPDARPAHVEQLCGEALTHGFMSVCVHPTHVALCAKLLSGSPVRVCTVIGFPLGASTSAVKAFEAGDAVANGAHELDMVINLGALKDGNTQLVLADIAAVVSAAGGRAIVKVIIETCLLTDDEKITACHLAKSAGADFVKTSTGFSTGGATSEDIALMRKTVGADMGVKASGGVRTRDAADMMIAAGATRIGTSNGIDIVK